MARDKIVCSWLPSRRPQMGDAGASAEVVDERLWNQDDKDAADQGAEKDKYEKGAAVQTKPGDELEFRGMDEDEGAQPQDDAKNADDECAAQRKQESGEKPVAPADDPAAEAAPINEHAEEDVEEAHGIRPEGAPDDDDAAPSAEELVLPDDMAMSLSGDEGERDADVLDTAADGDAGASDGGSDDAGADAADMHALDPDGVDDEGDDAVAEDHALGAPDDNTYSERDALNQGQFAAAGHRSGGADSSLQAPAAGAELPPPAPLQSHVPLGGLDADDAHGAPESEAADDSRPAVDDGAAAATRAAGAGGSTGGTGAASGGSVGQTAPSGEQPPSYSGDDAPRRVPVEPNPYRNLGDALQRWRERLSVRAFWHAMRRAFSLHSALRFGRTPDGCHTYLLPNTLIFPNWR